MNSTIQELNDALTTELKPDPAASRTRSNLQDTQVRYTLASGLELIADAPGGLLLSLRPLLAMRLNPQAFALLSQLGADCTPVEAAARAPGMTLADVSGFLDNLARRRFLTRKSPLTVSWPTVSVIIPAHGRPAATRACVESLLALDYPAEKLEIIIVDDASDPPLAPALENLPLRLLRQERNIGQSAARNLAASLAQGDLLAFIDNDCIATPDWLRVLTPYLSDPAMGIVGGRVIAPSPTGGVSAFEAVRSPLDMGPIAGEVGPDEVVSYLPTCNLIVRRELLLAQGGFDVTMRLGEDVDFIWRTLDTGMRACYVPDGQIVHYHRSRLWSLLCRRADYGSSEADLQRFHPKGRRLMRPPMAGMALLGMLALLTVYWPASIVLGLFALTGVVFELKEKFQRLRRVGADVPAHRVRKAVSREHMAAFYHLSANVIRYYSLPLLVLGLVWPNLLPALVPLLLAAPVTDYYRLEPSLSLPRFVGLYWLEMAAYQVGVWRGCLQRRTLKPLVPTLRLVR